MTIIGIVGGGQLGRMLALAAYPLGARVAFLDPAPDAPMSYLAQQITGAYDDELALDMLAQVSDVVTYEFENVPVTSAERIAQHVRVYPPPAALGVSQDRVEEKSFFRALEIPTPQFVEIDSLRDLEAGVAQLGLPAVLKTRRLGYDGKGQFVLRRPDQLENAFRALPNTRLILEPFVLFDRELSILAVRGTDGDSACYPLVENHHREGILRKSIAPAPDIAPQLQDLAQDYVRRVLDALGYVGVLAIELFQVRDQLLANEIAPRVHNSGHWTIEGAATSQFENHVRAILGLPLGSTKARCHSVMLNFIGALPDTSALLQIPDARLHLYDKAPRAGRKLGHVTLVANDAQTLLERADRAARIISLEHTTFSR